MIPKGSECWRKIRDIFDEIAGLRGVPDLKHRVIFEFGWFCRAVVDYHVFGKVPSDKSYLEAVEEADPSDLVSIINAFLNHYRRNFSNQR